MDAEATLQQFTFLVMAGVFSVMAVNFTYIFFLGRFFEELEQLDNATWQNLGSPRLRELMRGGPPTHLFASLRALRINAQIPKVYPAAARAWFWFRIAAVVTGLMFVGVGGGIFYLGQLGLT